ncbi:unnamed protein product [Amoebophrya sp. A120]|nr:unnamed protein product [Amoebophrya sp. A120]|eukprot:GSA120T00010896001.1
MLLDIVALFETQQRQDAWEMYCHAVARTMERKKPFCLKFASLGLLGRETLSGPVVFQLAQHVLERSGLEKRCVPEKIVKAKSFVKEEKNPPFARGFAKGEDVDLVLSLVNETVDRLCEILRSRHTLALNLVGIGRLTFQQDRKKYSFLERRWEPLNYVTGRDALDPEDYVDTADTEAKNSPGFTRSAESNPRTLVHPPKGSEIQEVSDLSSVDGDSYRGPKTDPSWGPVYTEEEPMTSTQAGGAAEIAGPPDGVEAEQAGGGTG